MEFKIETEIFEKFQGLNIGVIIAKNIDNTGESKQIINAITEEEKRIIKEFDTESLSQNPKINVWRKAYSTFGAKPKEHRSSVENLYRLILKEVKLKHINNLVDIYNFISIKYMLPVGGEDLDKMKGDVILTFANRNETPVLLLGDKEPRSPHEGEVIYKDEISTICRRWNWREADRTKLTEETKNCILVIEGLSPVTKGEIETAVRELKELVERYCGGNVVYYVLNENGTEVSI